MKIKKRLLALCLCVSWGLSAEAQEDPVLMRVGGDDVSRSEFAYSYRHHADAGSSPKEYARTFALRQLMVKAAREAGLDTTADFRTRRREWWNQLLDSCLTDRRTMDSCVLARYRSEDLAKSGGQVRILQIYKYLPQQVTAVRLEATRAWMDSISRLVEAHPDVDFKHLVQTCSDDQRERWIARRQESRELEEVAFSLPEGGVSTPFFTPEGIHLLKVTGRKDAPSGAEAYAGLAARLRRGEMPDASTAAKVEQLKSEYNFRSEAAGIDEWQSKGSTRQVLFTIDGQPYTGEQFALFAASHPQAAKLQWENFVAKSLLDYASAHLEQKHPEVRFAVREYENDELARAITRLKVDVPAATDRAGLTAYFEVHASDYRWDTPRYKGIVLHCANRRIARKAKKLLKKTPETDWADTIRKTFNTPEEEDVRIEQGVFVDGDNEYVDEQVFKKGKATPDMSYPFTIVTGKKLRRPESYREVETQVRKDYRNYLNAFWMRELEAAGKIEINQEVLKTVNNN